MIKLSKRMTGAHFLYSPSTLFSVDTPLLGGGSSFTFPNFSSVTKSVVPPTRQDMTQDLFLSYLPTPPLGQDMTHGQFLSRV